jgi:hypothetical protein
MPAYVFMVASIALAPAGKQYLEASKVQVCFSMQSGLYVFIHTILVTTTAAPRQRGTTQNLQKKNILYTGNIIMCASGRAVSHQSCLVFNSSISTHPELTEKWVQDLIADDQSILGLGELELRQKERVQPRGGRLDLLLQDPDTKRRYENELQLGSTDEAHIIRTIEY